MQDVTIIVFGSLLERAALGRRSVFGQACMLASLDVSEGPASTGLLSRNLR